MPTYVYSEPVKPSYSDIDAPSAPQLVEWALKINPSLAETDPDKAIGAATRLYVQASIAERDWCQSMIWIDGIEEELSKPPLRASLDAEEDTMRAWLEKNATHHLDKFKAGRPLLTAIRNQVEMGVALDRPTVNGKSEWRVKKLRLHERTINKGSNAEGDILLRIEEAREFLRLRELARAKPKLQKEWRKAWYSKQKASNKIAVKKAGKSAD